MQEKVYHDSHIAAAIGLRRCCLNACDTCWNWTGHFEQH